LLILRLQNKRWKAHHQYHHDLHQLFSLESREEERRIGLCITFHRKKPKTLILEIISKIIKKNRMEKTALTSNS
jgi:hypothetical protein